MSFSLILFVAALAGLLGFLYIRAGKNRVRTTAEAVEMAAFLP